MLITGKPLGLNEVVQLVRGPSRVIRFGDM
jgi:hypothetical protein